MNQGLTFAEAMSLDPSEVDVRCGRELLPGSWLPLDKYKFLSLNELRLSMFRRAKPKRSRVQEMADNYSGGVPGSGGAVYREFGNRCVRAVCEWLRTSEAGHMINRDLPGQVEREFLEPR